MTQETSEPTAIRCSGPGDALDAIPWMLGFSPTESLVMLTLTGPRSRFGPIMRVDLADPADDADLVSDSVEFLTGRMRCEQVLLVVYTDEGSADPLSQLPRQALLLHAVDRFERAGVTIRDAVVVRHGRWWSVKCDDPLCCPAEGTPVDHEVPSAVELSYRTSGAIPPMPSREALVDSLRLRPVEGVDAELARLTSVAGGLRTDTLAAQLREVVGHAMAQFAGRGRADLEPAVIALLIFLVQSTAVRDVAAELPGVDQLPDAVALWREVYAATPEPFRPQVGAVLAVVAWEAGAGALASSACESVLQLDPEHRLSRLTQALVHNGVRSDRRPTAAARVVRAMRSAGPPRARLRQVLPTQRAGGRPRSR